jgi:hypothetical protein
MSVSDGETVSVIFHDEQGKIRQCVVGSASLCDAQETPEGLTRLSWHEPVIAFEVYVKDGQVLPMGEAPYPMMRFDYGQKSWVKDEALAWSIVRCERNQKLSASDWTDTFSARTRLGEARFTAWQTYRQALRDITLQEDPYQLIWPEIDTHVF